MVTRGWDTIRQDSKWNGHACSKEQPCSGKHLYVISMLTRVQHLNVQMCLSLKLHPQSKGTHRRNNMRLLWRMYLFCTMLWTETCTAEQGHVGSGICFPLFIICDLPLGSKTVPFATNTSIFVVSELCIWFPLWHLTLKAQSWHLKAA